MIAPELREALEARLGDRVRFGWPMAKLTSLRVGGPADAVVTPADRAELAFVLDRCHRTGTPHCAIGGGFNTLALDGALEGVVIQLSRFRRLEQRPDGALRAEAGVSHSQVTRFCTHHGLAGLEFAAGIPGSVGGWLAMNAGIPKREMRDVVMEVEVFSPSGRGHRHLPKESLHFEYRNLAGLAPGSVIVSALFQVTRDEPARVGERVRDLLDRRARTQPLNVPSCGSVFKNPPGDHAGRLIEASGLKGFQSGGAQISPVHANFIANTGDAKAADVLTLIETAQEKVHADSGARLRREVRIVGSPA
jgi:UDP-N-acetylmuramate dehydrogenase